MVFGWDPRREREMASSIFDLEFVYPGRLAADLSLEGIGHAAVVDDGGDPVLTILGGGGGVDEQNMGRWETRFWLTPLPPPGATVRCTWADDDVNQTVGFDVDALNDAASAAQVLTD